MKVSKSQSVQISSIFITTLILSCQSDTPNLAKKPTSNTLPPLLLKRVKARQGNPNKVRQETFEALLAKRDLKNAFLGQNQFATKTFWLGDWERFERWENFYADVYNDPKFSSVIYDFISPYHSNNNGDQLCAYETYPFCTDAGCSTDDVDITLYGCVCPQQYNLSPPNYVEEPELCSQYDYLLPDTSENACNAMWDRVNSCYNAGGSPYYNENQCRFFECEGVEEGGGGDLNQFCQTYTVGDNEKESCVTCGDSGEMLYLNGHVSSCSPSYVSDSKAEFFQLESNDSASDAPYTQYVFDNQFCE